MATAIVTPGRTLEQRFEALNRANTIRTARASFKRGLRDKVDARARTVQLIEAPPALFESMRILELLRALPRVGEVKANRMLFRHQISPSRTLGGLTERQRCALRQELGGVVRASKAG